MMGLIPGGAALGSQAQAQGNYGSNFSATAMQNVTVPAPPVPTLARALSSLDDLNKRLSQISASSYQLASTIGGPFPIADNAGEAKEAEKPTAMKALNESIDWAHRQLSAIEQAVGAMSRSLGAST